MPPEIARSAPRRKEEFFHGRIAARYAVATNRRDDECATTLFGPYSAEPVIGIGPHREPLWPEGFIGSITHCLGVAAAIAVPEGPQRGVGIDIEHVVAKPDAIAALLHVVIDATELECLRAVTTAWPFELLLTLVFSAKESFYKAAFAAVGRVFGFEAVRLHLIDAQREVLGFIVAQPLGAVFSKGYSFEVKFAVTAPGTVLTSFIW
ncbi:4'-phosphopantetheinyl transferase Npt [Dyella sp. AD56]|nr:4'-phosphopantetheinyl transferase Npt [Dyella sp. AD56]